MTTVTSDDDSLNSCTVTVVRCNQYTTSEESKFEKKPKSELIVPGASISKKEPDKKPAKKPKRLYIVPGAPTLFYQKLNQNSCILSSLASALHHVGDGYVSEYIIRCKQKSLLENNNKFRMHFCRDNLIGHHNKNKNSIIVLRNGIHRRHMIYYGIGLLIKLCV